MEIPYSRNMAVDENIKILSVKQDGGDGLIVTFSDGTVGAYVVEELLELRPHREPKKSLQKYKNQIIILTLRTQSRRQG